MKIIGILLIVMGVIGILLGGMMFGDIGVTSIVAGIIGLLSGIGFILVNKKLKVEA